MTTGVISSWRSQEREPQPSDEQLLTIALLLLVYVMHGPEYADREPIESDMSSFLDDAWAAMRGVAPMPKHRLRVLLLAPYSEAREMGICLAGAGARRIAES